MKGYYWTTEKPKDMKKINPFYPYKYRGKGRISFENMSFYGGELWRRLI